MDRQRRDLAALDQRHDEQVERHAAVNAREPVGLDDQGGLAPLVVEPRESARKRLVGNEHARAATADAETVRLGPVAAEGHVAELGQHPAAEPAQQRGTFRIAGAVGVLGHQRTHARPVGDRRTYVGQRQRQFLLELAPFLRVDPTGLDVDHRFGGSVGGDFVGQCGQSTRLVAPRRENGMEQQVDRETLCGDRRGERIDQERHVAVDHRDARCSALADRRAHQQRRLVRRLARARLRAGTRPPRRGRSGGKLGLARAAAIRRSARAALRPACARRPDKLAAAIVLPSRRRHAPVLPRPLSPVNDPAGEARSCAGPYSEAWVRAPPIW
jgi:hypothetical protein